MQSSPGVNPDLIDGWISDRYQQMLDGLSWNRLRQVQAISLAAEYATGTVTVTQGSTAITGSGTTWTALMTGRMIRIAALDDFYQFTRVSATTGTLDRAYIGDSGSGLSYRINQNVVTLDTDVRLVESVRDSSMELTRFTQAQMRRSFPARNSYGAPAEWSWYPDANTDPPVIQIEVFPVPVVAVSLLADVIVDTSGLDVTDATSSLLPWTRPACLIAGVQADVSVHLDQLPKAALYEARFDKLLLQMKGIDHEADGPQPIGIADRYTRHQRNRYRR